MWQRLSLIFMLLGLVLLEISTAVAHYPILIGDRSPMMGQSGGNITLTYGRGHLHAPQWTEAQAPDLIKAYTFDGMTEDLTDKAYVEGLTRKLNLPVKQIGDTWIVLHLPLAWSDEDRAWTETTVRTVIHLGLSRGWETLLGLPLEIVPLNRPYGILPGDVFRVQVLIEGKPVPGVRIYAEKFHKPPMKKPYPPDEIITRVAQTAPDGTALVTLHSSGWWILFVTHEQGEIEREGKSAPVVLQDAVWIYVEPGQGRK